MQLHNEVKLDFDDVLIRPKRSTISSRKDVSLERDFIFRNSPLTYTGVPIMAANMDGVGTFEVAEALADYNMFTCLTKHYSTQKLTTWINDIGGSINNNWAYSLGTSDIDLDKFESVYNSVTERSIKFVNIDVANGYTEKFIDYIANFKDKYPELIVIAGNVVTGEITEQLLLKGASIVKVGIGQGAVCETRLKAGVGYPQLSAVIECADAAHGLGGHIISDGGCKIPADVAKAFGGGADFVMLGSMLAGTDEGQGEIIIKRRKTGFLDHTDKEIVEELKFVQFYGMSSETAMVKHYGSRADYRASEGRTIELPYKGPMKPVVEDILGGLRSSCSYVGATKLKHLSKCTTFIRVNNTYNKSMERYTVK